MLNKEVGPYKILEKIGQGGMGIVYKGIHIALEQVVAIKVLSPQFLQDPNMRKRFIKEARIQAKFSHPNVVNMLNYVEENEDVFLIMEYIDGETLEKRLRAENVLTIEEAVSVSLNVLHALDFMHSKGVIHRDIKPSNIMFKDSGSVKVTDFGIAKVIGEKALTRTGLVGTFRYMSPEQILGGETSVASDIYSCGITFYEMVTGRVPFNSDSEYKVMKGHLEEKPLPPMEVNSKIPKGLSKVILKALAKNPKDRYQNVKDFIKDIEIAIKKSKWSKVLPQGVNTRLWEFNADKRRLPLLTLMAILLILIFPIFRKASDYFSLSNTISRPKTDISASAESNISVESLHPNIIIPATEIALFEAQGTQIKSEEAITDETSSEDSAARTINKKAATYKEQISVEEPARKNLKKVGALEEGAESEQGKIKTIRKKTTTKKEKIQFSRPDNNEEKWKIRK